MIGGHVKPNRFTIDEKEVLLRRLVFPSHFPWALKVSGSGFHPNQTAVVRVAFKKRSLQCFGRTISLLQASDDHLGIRASDESEEKRNQRVNVCAHAKSLPVHGVAHTGESPERSNCARKQAELEIHDDQMGGSVSVAAAELL